MSKNDNHHGVDIQALMRALPISGLEPEWVASICGLIDVPDDQRWREVIRLLEPPAGQRIPYIDPLKAIEKLLRRQGISCEDSLVSVREVSCRMKEDLADSKWVNFFDTYESESPACLPVSDFINWIRKESYRANQHSAIAPNRAQELNKQVDAYLMVPTDIINFLEKATQVATSTPMFRGPDNWNETWSLENLPSLPPPKAMIEFVPGAPWLSLDEWDDWRVPHSPFMQWRGAIRPVAQELEKVLGEPVYHFADLDDPFDDDDIHRFLVLHWCCTWRPESAYVRYLVKASGAKSVEELKRALIDPASYVQPFKMYCSFFGTQMLPCRIDYLPPNRQKTVTVVFFTPLAREVAQALLPQKIGARAFIVAPKELATDEWVRHATRFCKDWTVRYEIANELTDPIEILSITDELYVIADEKRPDRGFDLMLSELVEDLLWLAIDFGVDAKYYSIDGIGLFNPQDCLCRCGVPERVAESNIRRTTFTRQLKEIRLENDFGSSGLWSADGKMLPYDLLNLPFPIVKRIAAWQRDYDDTMNPPDMGDKAWWDLHEQDALEIAVSLQDALGSDITVKLYQAEGWLPVEQIVRMQQIEP